MRKIFDFKENYIKIEKKILCVEKSKRSPFKFLERNHYKHVEFSAFSLHFKIKNKEDQWKKNEKSNKIEP